MRRVTPHLAMVLAVAASGLSPGGDVVELQQQRHRPPDPMPYRGKRKSKERKRMPWEGKRR